MKRKNIVLIVLGVIVILIAVIIIAANSNRSEIHSHSVNVVEPNNNLSEEFPAAIHKTEVPDGYIGIYTIDDFEYIRTTPSGNYILMNDLDFSSVIDWKSPDFKNGIFDGNNYSINNYKQSVSLFNELLNATIQNLNIKNVETTANAVICKKLFVNSQERAGLTNCKCSGVLNCSISDNIYYDYIETDDRKVDVSIGGLIGKMEKNDGNLIIDNCSFDGTINVKLDWNRIYEYYNNGLSKYHQYKFRDINIGGIVGSSYKCNIVNCKSAGNIIVDISNIESVGNHIGGIAGGLSIDSNIKYSQNKMNIISSTDNATVGGIVGYAYGFESMNFREVSNLGNIELNGRGATAGGILGKSYSYMPIMNDCYNKGDLSATYAGGISYSSSVISGCYNAGKISGTGKAGALTADKSEQIEYSYYLNNGVDVTGDGGKYPYVKALSEEEMKNQSSFEWLNFNDVWTFLDGEYKYPTLKNCE